MGVDLFMVDAAEPEGVFFAGDGGDVVFIQGFFAPRTIGGGSDDVGGFANHVNPGAAERGGGGEDAAVRLGAEEGGALGDDADDFFGEFIIVCHKGAPFDDCRRGRGRVKPEMQTN